MRAPIPFRAPEKQKPTQMHAWKDKKEPRATAYYSPELREGRKDRDNLPLILEKLLICPQSQKDHLAVHSLVIKV